MVRKKNKKLSKARKHAPTRHHIIPSSRGGTSGLENIAIVSNMNHQNYHNLFQNKIPEEIIYTLVEDYWKGDWEYVMSAYKKYNG